MNDRLSAARGETPGNGVVVAAALDTVLVALFAIIGRSSHAEALDATGVWGTAWPFLAGLGVGWAVSRAWRHPFAVWPTGVLVWAATLVVGMLLRVATGQGIAVAFVIVASITLAIFLVGWRSLAALTSRIRRRPRSTAAVGGTRA